MNQPQNSNACVKLLNVVPITFSNGAGFIYEFSGYGKVLVISIVIFFFAFNVTTLIVQLAWSIALYRGGCIV